MLLKDAGSTSESTMKVRLVQSRRWLLSLLAFTSQMPTTAHLYILVGGKSAGESALRTKGVFPAMTPLMRWCILYRQVGDSSGHGVKAAMRTKCKFGSFGRLPR